MIYRYELVFVVIFACLRRAEVVENKTVLDDDATTSSKAIENMLGSELVYSSIPPTGGRTAIDIDLKLYHIVDVSDVHQTVTAKWKMRVSWDDSRMAWNHTDTKREMLVIMKSAVEGKVWLPTIKLQQIMQTTTIIPPFIQLERDGRMTIVVQATVQFECPMRTPQYPFDIQVAIAPKRLIYTVCHNSLVYSKCLLTKGNDKKQQ